jgi:hypothetical protein
MLLKSMLIWLSIIPLAILNGGFRQGFLEPLVGIKIANPISCLLLCILIFIVSFIFIPRLGNGTKRIYIKIGLLWLFSTIIFETVLGLLLGNSLSEIINAYNVATGNLWSAVVIFIGFVPMIIAKIKRIV